MSPKEALQVIKSKFTDQYGHIVQADGDKGDTASREGLVAALVMWNYEFSPETREDYAIHFGNILSQLEKEPGIYVRHRYPSVQDQDYVKDPARFSRDQQTPLEVAMGLCHTQEERLHRLFWAHSNRLYKYQNKDWWIGSYGRSLFQKKSLRLYIEDMSLLVNSCLAHFRRFKDKFTKLPDTSNDVIHSLLIIQSSKICPTALSKLATWIYKFSNPQKALDSYFAPNTGAAPINDLYRPLLKEVL